MKKNKDYELSSGNVFADLGFPDAEERLAKAELARQINNLIEQQNITQIAAAELFGIDQPKISALSTGKLSGFSLERLFKFLNILGQDITIKITPKPKKAELASLNIIASKKRNPIPISNPENSFKTVQAKKRK